MNWIERRKIRRDIAALRLLEEKIQDLPIRSLERDILICAQLYLEGDTQPGHTVERWWQQQEAA